MKIDIHELRKKSEVTFKGEQQVSLRGVNPERPDMKCLAYVEGLVTKTGSRYIVEGNVKTQVKLICARCLEEYDYPMEVSLYQIYSTEPVSSEDDEEIIQVSESEIDLEDAITEAIYLNVPMKWLHDEACKGICKVCGQNLNKQSCKCDVTDIDPRLEGLKNIFHPQSEE